MEKGIQHTQVTHPDFTDNESGWLESQSRMPGMSLEVKALADQVRIKRLRRLERRARTDLSPMRISNQARLKFFKR